MSNAQVDMLPGLAQKDQGNQENADSNRRPEAVSLAGPVLSQQIISGKRRLLVRLRIRAGILRIIFRNYRSFRKSFQLLLELDKFRKSALGERRVMKYAFVDGKYYLGLYIPGFNSKAFEAFILGEVNRIVPVGKPVNRLTNVLLSITKKCALRCEHCSEWDTLNGRESLSVEDIYKLVSDLRMQGTAQIHFSGGEPLQRLDDLVEVVRRIDRSTECWVLTSGHNLTPGNAQKLKSAGFTGVVVSIDHFDPESHNRFRGSEKAFGWAQEAVRNAISAKLVTAVSLCVTREFASEENLFRYAEMAKHMGVSYIQLFEPKAVGHYLGKEVELTAGQEKILEDFFYKMNNDKRYRKYPIVIYHGYYQRRIGCLSAGNRHVYIDSDGDIHNCPFCRKKAGNALTGNIEQILLELKERGCGKSGNSGH